MTSLLFITLIITLSVYIFIQNEVLKDFGLSYKDLGRVIMNGARTEEEANTILFSSLKVNEKYPMIKNITWDILNFFICGGGMKGFYRAFTS